MIISTDGLEETLTMYPKDAACAALNSTRSNSIMGALDSIVEKQPSIIKSSLPISQQLEQILSLPFHIVDGLDRCEARKKGLVPTYKNITGIFNWSSRAIDDVLSSGYEFEHPIMLLAEILRGDIDDNGIVFNVPKSMCTQNTTSIIPKHEIDKLRISNGIIGYTAENGYSLSPSNLLLDNGFHFFCATLEQLGICNKNTPIYLQEAIEVFAKRYPQKLLQPILRNKKRLLSSAKYAHTMGEYGEGSIFQPNQIYNTGTGYRIRDLQHRNTFNPETR